MKPPRQCAIQGCKRSILSGVVCPVCCHYAALGDTAWREYVARGCREPGEKGIRYEIQQDREPRICSWCGEEFLARVTSSVQCCSSDCRSAAQGSGSRRNRPEPSVKRKEKTK
jgi:hypothetical protein